MMSLSYHATSSEQPHRSLGGRGHSFHARLARNSAAEGKAVAFLKPVIGRKPVTKLLLGVFQKFYADNTILKKTMINHEPALCYYQDGKLVTCQIFSLQKDGLNHVYFIRNPDKLKALEKNLSKAVTL